MELLAGIFVSILYYARVISTFLVYLPNPSYSPDSWTYFELSKTMFTNFYHINTFRQLQTTLPFGISFPPLFPALISIFNALFNSSAYAGFLINFILTLCIPFVIYFFIRKNILFASFVSLLLWSNKHFVEEVISGRSIPLSVVLFIIITGVAIRSDRSYRTIVILGVINGLMTLNRFDHLLAGIFFGISYSYIVNRKSSAYFLKSALVYFLSYVVLLSPWISYSMFRFHTLFVSDNSRNFQYVSNIFVLDVVPKSGIQTLFNAPKEWVVAKLTNMISFVNYLINELSAQHSIRVSALLALVFALRRIKITKSVLSGYVPIYLLLSGQFITLAFTGYDIRRYFILTIFFISYFIFGQLFRKSNSLFVILIAVASYYLFAVSGDPFGWSIDRILETNYTKQSTYVLEDRKKFKALQNELVKTKSARILFDNTSGYDYVKFGALTGTGVIFPPSNINSCNLEQTIVQFNATHIYSRCPHFLKSVSKYFTIDKSGLEGLYIVSPRRITKDTVCSFERDVKFFNCVQKDNL